jgi:hypothetical protein
VVNSNDLKAGQKMNGTEYSSSTESEHRANGLGLTRYSLTADHFRSADKTVLPRREIRFNSIRESNQLIDMISLFAKLNDVDGQNLFQLWDEYTRKSIFNASGDTTRQDLKSSLMGMPSDDPDTAAVYLAAGAILKMCLPSCPAVEQLEWMQKLHFILSILIEKTLQIPVYRLEAYEQYYISAYRFATANLFLAGDQLSDKGRSVLGAIHSSLVTIKAWQLGCQDDDDLKLLEAIQKSYKRIEPGSHLLLSHYNIIFALILFRQPDRVARHIKSDQVFKSYLDNFKSKHPELEGNIYACRQFACNEYRNELALWYVENYDGLLAYKNAHQGESCFLIGNGPSLRQMDLSPLRERVTIGLNKIYLLFDKLGFQTTYLTAANPYVIQQAAEEFASLSMPQFTVMWGREFSAKHPNVLFLREKYQPLFSTDITKGVNIDSTVTYLAMQIAYYMGFETVVLIGVDHSFQSKGDPHTTVKLGGSDPNHFDPSYFGYGVPWQLPDLDGSARAYQRAKGIFEASGRRILDATVGGKLQVYEKISYERALSLTV